MIPRLHDLGGKHRIVQVECNVNRGWRPSWSAVSQRIPLELLKAVGVTETYALEDPVE